MTKIDLLDGKYTVIHDNWRGLRALRYGEEWRNLAGDNLVMAMAQEIEELQGKLSEAESLLYDSQSLMGNVHCYDTDVYRSITEYFGEGDDE